MEKVSQQTDTRWEEPETAGSPLRGAWDRGMGVRGDQGRGGEKQGGAATLKVCLQATHCLHRGSLSQSSSHNLLKQRHKLESSVPTQEPVGDIFLFKP